jgi:hypothetical protein
VIALPARLARLARVAGIIVPAAASTAWTPVGFRPRFIHRKRPAAGIFAIQSGDGLVRFFIIRHFHKTKAA